MSVVFVSYRRIDSAGAAGRIYDRLVSEFGKTHVFMDIEGSIPHGADFPVAIERAVATSSAFLVVIGRHWMTCTDDQGNPRIHNQDDWVSNEVAAALERNILVIPVLVDGASMPQESTLPKRIAGLSRRQALDIRASSWDYDLRRIISTLKPVLRTRSWRTISAIAVAAVTAIGIGLFATRALLTGPTADESAPEPRVAKGSGNPLLSGLYSLDFSGLEGADRTPFQGSEAKGFRIAPLSRNWLVGTGYGHPAPYIFFVREADEKKPVSGSVSITASGQTFLFESVEVYSSVERTPFVITGYLGERTVFKMAGVVPNTYGDFARVDNTEKQTPVDKASIAVETYTENPISNPVGLDNIVVRVVRTEGANGATGTP